MGRWGYYRRAVKPQVLDVCFTKVQKFHSLVKSYQDFWEKSPSASIEEKQEISEIIRDVQKDISTGQIQEIRKQCEEFTNMVNFIDSQAVQFSKDLKTEIEKKKERDQETKVQEESKVIRNKNKKIKTEKKKINKSAQRVRRIQKRKLELALLKKSDKLDLDLYNAAKITYSTAMPDPRQRKNNIYLWVNNMKPLAKRMAGIQFPKSTNLMFSMTDLKRRENNKFVTANLRSQISNISITGIDFKDQIRNGKSQKLRDLKDITRM